MAASPPGLVSGFQEPIDRRLVGTWRSPKARSVGTYSALNCAPCRSFPGKPALALASIPDFPGVEAFL
jgi:hypothetical protein